MTGRSVLTIFSLVLLIGIGGCRRKVESGGRNFSFNFNSEKEEDLAVAASMYDALCDELENRDFKQSQVRTDTEEKSTRYEGEYQGFPLTVEIRHLLSVSQDEPEFYYRVSFEETSDVEKLDEAAKDLRVLMEQWCAVGQAMDGP